jgi:hypothetical protein
MSEMGHADDEGLGLDEFLGYDPDKDKGGGGGAWLKPWKKAKKIDIWLHLASKIHAVWGHQFILDDEIDEKDDQGQKTGRTKQILRWPRFVSPDTGNIHANQYFRDNDILRETTLRDRHGKEIRGADGKPLYMSDPFLLLREYLRRAARAGVLDVGTTVFEWVDHKKQGQLINWTVGELSGLVKRGRNNRGHSLDGKLEYIFTVIQHEKPEEGPKITRETKLLGDLMRDEIKKQIESRGDEEGNPFKYPYCFRWEFDPDAPTPMKSYRVFRVDKNACTDEVWDAIGGNEGAEPPPDTAQYARVNDGDMEKIRAAFENAAQIDLPLEAIFSPDPDVRKSVVTGAILRGASTSTSSAGSTRKASAEVPEGGTGARGAVRPGAAPGASRSAATTSQAGARRPGAASAPADAPAGSSTAESAPATRAGGPPPRRKKVTQAEPPPPKEPEVEKFKCEGPDDETPCGKLIPVTCEKCPHCGAEYEIEPDDTAPPSAPEPAPAPTGVKRPTSGGANPDTVTDSGNFAPGGAKRPSTAAAEEVADEKPCFACGHDVINLVETDEGQKRVCANCGMDQGDDIPFDLAPGS